MGAAYNSESRGARTAGGQFEGGSFSAIQCLSAAFFAVLGLALLHGGTNVVDKMQAQNAADAGARAAAVWLARGLNVISAANHAAGEVVGMLAVREAMVATVEKAHARLDAQLAAITTDREQLQETSGPTVVSTNLLLDERQAAVEAERALLAELARRAFELDNACHELRTVVLPRLQTVAATAVAQAPKQAHAAAEYAAQQSAGKLVFLRAELPVVPDPLAGASLLDVVSNDWYGPRLSKEYYTRPENVARVDIGWNQVAKITQLARASYPWALYHGLPIRRYLSSKAPLSMAADLYGEQLLVATRRLADDVQRSGQFRAYVITESTLPDKGYERWTDEPQLVDRNFGVLGLVAYGKVFLPGLTGRRLFELDKERYVYAQALVYNANPQQRNTARINLRIKRIYPDRQPDIGWDTLQWDSERSRPPFEMVMQGTDEPLRSELPQVRVNWQAKLTPVSADLVAELSRRRPTLVRQAGLSPVMTPLFQTH